MAEILSIIMILTTLSWAYQIPSYESIAAAITSILSVVFFYKQKQTLSPKLSNSIDNMPKAQSKQSQPIMEESAIQRTPKESNPLPIRFIKIFELHGIHRNEIPRIIPKEFNISYTELSSNENLMYSLTPQVIDWVSKTFGITVCWLEGSCEYMYSTKNFYKNEHALLHLLQELKNESTYALKVFAFKDVPELNGNSKEEQNINLLIAIPIMQIDNKTIYKYIPTSTLWDWGYWRSRYQLKGIIKTCHMKLNLYFDGFDLDKDTISKLSVGKVFPKEVIDEKLKGKSCSWYPDDYTDSPSDSFQSKESYELENVMSYIAEQKYLEALDSKLY